MYGKSSEQKTCICEAFKNKDSGLLAYRVMEEIRNYLQHRALPISGALYFSAWEERQSGQLLHHRIIPKLLLTHLAGSDKFKPRVLRELKETGKDEHDISLFVREYIEGLSAVHGQLREVTKADIRPWSNHLTGALARYEHESGEPRDFIVAYKFDEEHTIEKVDLLLEVIDRLQKSRETPLPINISRLFVSNEPLSSASS